MSENYHTLHNLIGKITSLKLNDKLLLHIENDIQAFLSMIILILSLKPDHSLWPAVDDVCPPGLGGGVSASVVKSSARMNSAPTSGYWAGSTFCWVTVIGHLHMVTCIYIKSGGSMFLKHFLLCIDKRHTWSNWPVFSQSFFMNMASPNKPHTSIVHCSIFHWEPE